MHKELDLEGLTPQEATSYVAKYLAAHKQAHQRREQAKQEFARWEGRVRLAHERGETELAKAALARADKASKEFQQARAEEKELAITCDLLKQRLERLARQPEFSVDAEALLSQMQNMIDSGANGMGGRAL